MRGRKILFAGHSPSYRFKTNVEHVIPRVYSGGDPLSEELSYDVYIVNINKALQKYYWTFESFYLSKFKQIDQHWSWNCSRHKNLNTPTKVCCWRVDGYGVGNHRSHFLISHDTYWVSVIYVLFICLTNLGAAHGGMMAGTWYTNKTLTAFNSSRSTTFLQYSNCTRMMRAKTLYLTRHGQALHNVRAEGMRHNGCSIEDFMNQMKVSSILCIHYLQRQLVRWSIFTIINL